MPNSPKKIAWPNGSKSIEFGHQTIWMEAPNPFGGTWRLSFENKMFGRGRNYIRRRGAYWHPDFDAKAGWSWKGPHAQTYNE